MSFRGNVRVGRPSGTIIKSPGTYTNTNYGWDELHCLQDCDVDITGPYKLNNAGAAGAISNVVLQAGDRLEGPFTSVTLTSGTIALKSY